jgi:isoprenylcysteine carboxyl methyltransferase (ICMT) family protein YpbQ
MVQAVEGLTLVSMDYALRVLAELVVVELVLRAAVTMVVQQPGLAQVVAVDHARLPAATGPMGRLL